VSNMSNRIITGAAAKAAKPLAWVQSHTPKPGASVQPAGQAQDDQLAEQLRARIRELEASVHQAFQSGRREGDSMARQELAARLDAACEKFARAIDEVAGLRTRVRGEAEEDVVRLSVAIGRKILHRELTIDPDALHGLVKAAMQRVDARDVNRVRMHPEDFPHIQRAMAAVSTLRNIELVPDASLERGAAIFETTRGNLDASIETQLREIERGFTDLVRSHR
jgi:flagellar assembly protein FliH